MTYYNGPYLTKLCPCDVYIFADILLSDEPPEAEYEYVVPTKMVIIENEFDACRKQSPGMPSQPSSVDAGGPRNSLPNWTRYETIPLPPMPPAISEGKNEPPCCESDDGRNDQGLKRESSIDKSSTGKRRGPPTFPRRIVPRPSSDYQNVEQQQTLMPIDEDGNRWQQSASTNGFIEDIGMLPVNIASLSVEEVS